MKDLKERILSPTYHYTKLQNKLYGEIHEYLKNTEGMNRTKLAKKLGVTKGYVSQLMNSGADHKLSKLIKLSLAIGKIPNIEFLDSNIYKEKELNRREDKMPLDLESLTTNLCQSNKQIRIKKEKQEHDIISFAKPYSEF